MIILLILIAFIFPSYAYGQSTNLDTINQKVSSRFEEDLSKLSAIMEEVRTREGILETRVAFGGIDTPIKEADYWITYGAEAIAYQRAQKFSSQNQLRSSLVVLKGKILRAKREVSEVVK